jgi:tetratricopeptide (TPR) repeat protein
MAMKGRAARALAPVAVSVLLFSAAAFAQGRTAPAAGSVPPSFDPTVFGTVVVYLRMEDGQPLPAKVTPVVGLAASGAGAALPNAPTRVGEGYMFSGVGIGNEYEVRVTAEGYEPGREIVRVPNVPGASSEVIVFMHPVDQELVFHRPTGQFVLPPKAEKEVQHTLEDLQYGQVPSARKHGQRAIAIAPDNPYVQYAMGMTYLLTSQWKEAKPYFEKSVSIDPRQPLSLRALGTTRYQLEDDAGAVEALTKSIQLDATSWKAEWILTAAFLREKRYQEARDHAEQALKIGKKNAGQVQFMLGQALADLGEREAADKTFEKFAAEYPRDPNAPKALEWAKLMRETPKEATANPALPGSANVAVTPPVEIPPRPDWSPPDVDLAKPFLVSTATCPLGQVLKIAGEDAEQFVSTLEEFSATEEFQGIEIKRSGQLERPQQQAFNYLVFVQRVSPKVFDVKEVRSGRGTEEAQLPGRLADTGVAALALAFHPAIQDDLEWQCEGVGTWNNESAWVVHFRQKPNEPNVLASFTTASQSYSLPLKGRAWISERNGQVLHLDTDLVNEIQPIDLKRQHFSIDYHPVLFPVHQVELWLPENVDTYIQYRGHFLHYYHHFGNFKLFWVGATQKLGEPKESSPPER